MAAPARVAPSHRRWSDYYRYFRFFEDVNVTMKDIYARPGIAERESLMRTEVSKRDDSYPVY